jgi:copper oxidase (laccase) domain-containing protein
MEVMGADRSNITAAIGPAIQQASYEVGPEFRDTWVGTYEWTDRLFKAGESDHSYFDLTGYIQAILLREGISAIDNLGHDTCAMEDDYFSNRRRNHHGEPDYGRNGSVIMLEA